LFNLVADIFKQWIKGFKVSDPATKQRCKCHLEKRKEGAQMFLMKLLIEPYFKKGSNGLRKSQRGKTIYLHGKSTDWQLLKTVLLQIQKPSISYKRCSSQSTHTLPQVELR